MGSIESCRLCRLVAESSVVMPELVEEDDDVGRGGCCRGCCRTDCYLFSNAKAIGR